VGRLDLDVETPPALVFRLVVLDARVREVHLLVEVRQVVLPRPFAHLGGRAFAVMLVVPVTVSLVPPSVVVALQLVVEHDASHAPATVLDGACRVLVGAAVHVALAHVPRWAVAVTSAAIVTSIAQVDNVVARGAFGLPVSAAGAAAETLAVAAPLAAVQVRHELQGHGRSLAAQLCGAMAAAITAAAIAMAGGWPPRPALGLSLLLGLQPASAIVYVGTRLRLARGVHASPWPAWALHACALAVTSGLVYGEAIGGAALVAFAILTLRAFAGLRPSALRTRTVIVGVQEIGFSLLTVVGLWLAARYGW
jgi:hypothetical protein